MFKHIIALIALSIAVILSMSYAQLGLQWLIDAHDWVSGVLTDVFTGGQAGNIARSLIALLSIPVLLGLVPTLIYWAIRRSWFPYFMQIVWIVWLLQIGALLMLSKTLA
jgi:hypothetical protein